jgi:Malectin domain
MNLALTSAAGLVLLLSAIAGVGSGQTVIDVDCGSATDMTSALSGRSTAISIDGSTPIAGTEDDQRFRAYRQARGRAANFTYSFNSLPAGKYSVILGFAEVVSGNCANGRRQFSVALSGRDVLTNFDVYGAARACNTAVLQTFPATVSAASPLTIQFRPGNSGRPFISSIIVATVGGGGGTTLPPTGTTRAPTGTTLPPTGTTRAPTGTTLPLTGTTLPPTGTTLPTTGTTRSTTGTTRAPTGTATTTVSSSQVSLRGQFADLQEHLGIGFTVKCLTLLRCASGSV